MTVNSSKPIKGFFIDVAGTVWTVFADGTSHYKRTLQITNDTATIQVGAGADMRVVDAPIVDRLEATTLDSAKPVSNYTRLAAEYNASMSIEVLHSWAQDAVRALIQADRDQSRAA